VHTTALSFRQLIEATGYRRGIFDVACPLCGPDRRAATNRTRKVMRVWNVCPDFLTYACARCGETGYAQDHDAPPINANAYARVKADLAKRNRETAANRLSKALALWRSRQSLQGSIAEIYLREVRAYRGPLPPTLGFLPARGDYPPAMIAAFGLPLEPEPSVMALPDDWVTGVHLTRLSPDGTDRDRGDKAKIMIGFSKGSPLMLSPWTDSLGLVVTEGIEDALSAYESTGLCAWAAGSASRLPALADAVPSWVEAITILADDDADGRRHAATFADQLKERDVEIRLIVLGCQAQVSAA
jgi:hypothetical protein